MEKKETEKIDLYLEMYRSIKSNKFIIVKESKEFIDELIKTLNDPVYKWEDDTCIIYKTEKTSLFKALREHNCGNIKVNMKIQTIRNVVSRYNKITGERFKVLRVSDFCGVVNKDLENNKIITNQIFQQIKESYQYKLDCLKNKIVSDEEYLLKNKTIIFGGYSNEDLI